MAGYGDGGVYRHPRSKFLWVAYWVEGKKYRESTGTTDQKEAEAYLRRRIAEKRASYEGLLDFVGPQRIMLDKLLDALEDDYRIHSRKSLSQLHYHLRTVRRRLEGLRAIEMDSPRVRLYIRQRQDEGAKNATINRELAAIRRALNLARQEGLLRQVPHFPKLPEQNVRKGFFEREQFERIVRHLPDYLQDLVRFAYLTGWRRGDILSLRWEYVEERIIRLPDSKNGEGRILALEGELWDIIQRKAKERVVGLRENGWVFHRNGAQIRSFKEAWKTARIAAGVQGKAFHDFRRTTVRNLVRAGVPDKVAMDMTGHKTRSIFDRYNITSEDDLRDASRKLQAYLAGVPVKTPK
jgi:integrase